MNRPKWCPHLDCRPMYPRTHFCGGELPYPEPHLDGMNSHRICFKPEDEKPIDIQVHKGDVWWMSRQLDGFRKEIQKQKGGGTDE